MSRWSHSFRIKLAVLTTIVCGVVLFLFALGVWTFHLTHTQSRFDEELIRLADHHLHFVIHDDREFEVEQDRVEHLEAMHDHAHGHEGVDILDLPETFLGGLFETVSYGLFDRRGKLIASSDGWPVDLAPEGYDLESVLGIRTSLRNDRRYRVVYKTEDEYTMSVAVDLHPLNSQLNHVRWFLFGTAALAILVIAVSSWAIANRAIRPVRALTGVAEQITADALDRRIPIEHEDREFSRLIEVFNGMLGRLEASFQQAARFTADASHELKTPLTIMQGHVELALSRAEEGSDAQRALVAQLDEVQRLKRLVKNLLVLSRADGGLLRLDKTRVDLSALVRAQCEDLGAIAGGIEIECDVEPSVFVEADELLLQQALQNLASNGVKYNYEGGRVRVRLERTGGHAVIEIANTGPEIDETDRAHIFDRFYRVDTSRNREVDGVGLGLSLVAEIIRAHAGHVVYVGRVNDENVFRVTLNTSADA